MQNEHYSLEAEVELLGMLIQDKNRLDNIDYIKSEHFYLTVHSDIYFAIKTLVDKQQLPDIINIESHLMNNEGFQEVGGKNYLLKIQQTLSYSTIRGRAELIYSLYLKRKLINIGEQIIDDGNKSDFLTIKDTIASAEQKIFQLNSQREDLTPNTLNDVADEVMTDLYDIIFNNRATGLSTGFQDLDEITSGLKKGDLVILAAASSVGKTAMSLSMAYNMVKNDMPILFFSLEMTKKELTKRLIAINSNVNVKTLDTGKHFGGEKHNMVLNKDEYNIIKEETIKANNIPLYIQDKSDITISNIRSIGRKMKRDKGIQIIFVDYIQLIKNTNNDKNKTDAGRMSEIAHGLKALAKELDLPIIALSQLSREHERRDSKKPVLSDLKESGAIGEAADLVMFLYRESYYLERSKPEYVENKQPTRMSIDTAEYKKEYQKELDSWGEKKLKYKEWQKRYDAVKNAAEIIIAKNRKGAIGSFEIHFDPNKTKFSNTEKVAIINDPKEPVKQIGRSDWDKMDIDF